MSDYARLLEENAVLKTQIAEGTATTGTKSTFDSAVKAECDRLLAVLQDIADGDETKSDMKDKAAKAVAAHRRHAAADARRNVEPAANG